MSMGGTTMIRKIAALAPLAALAMTPVSAADVGAAHIQPGMWRSTETVLEMTSALLSPEQVAARKAKPMVFESCIASDDLRVRLLGSDKLGLCQGRAEVSNGRIDIDRQCRTGLGKTARRLQGTYGPTRYEYVQESELAAPQGTSRTKSRIVVERIGDCRGG